MKLGTKEFKRFKELMSLIKSGKASEADKAEFAKLEAMKNDRGSNDLQWWKNYPELLKDVVNIAFNYIPGTSFPIVNSSNGDDSLRLGLLASATLRPAIGRSESDADAFNSQIRQLWLDMHRKYRGIGTYEKSDLGIMILAVNAVFETIAKFERVYGVINTYHVGNRAVPYALKEALHISDSLEQDLADFRYQLNLRISKVKQLCLPKGLSVLMSDIVSLSNIFKDSKDRRAFMFLFDTDLFGIFSAAAISTGGSVLYNKFSNYESAVTPGGHAAFTLTNICAILDAQINALLNDDDIARMCSDLIAAYGPENVMQIGYLPDDYKIEPVEDYERLLQFNNLTICGPVATIYESSVIDNTAANNFLTNGYPVIIYQHDNVIKGKLGVGESGYVSNSGEEVPTIDHSNRRAKNAEVIFNTWVEQPGETEIMCGTRYTTVCGQLTVVDATHWSQRLYAYGTKVCTVVEVFWYNDSTKVYDYFKIDGSLWDVSFFRSSILNIMRLTQMDWHPTLYVEDASNNVELFGDVDNIAKITGDNLARLHEVALLSGYYIPMVSKE